ncbi:amidohydrolase [Jonquetella sp. BV3C21]|nr:amidohydrolase [Jonquetella sp. BV3C21]
MKLLFQPAEETLQGSRYLIDHGALENPHVDTIIGLHGTSDFHTGEMAFLEGPAMASSDSFIVTVTGEASHGAYPHVSGRDPLLAAANCIVALQGLVTRQFNAIDSLVLSVCEIHGGKAPNAIPQAVSFSGTVRTQCEAVRRQVEGRMNTMLADICAGYGCTHTTEYRYGVPPLVNDPEMVASARRAACNLLGADKVKTLPYPSMGSEDFAFYGERVPKSVFARLGVWTAQKPQPKYHNGEFVFDEDALPLGTAFFVQIVQELLGPSAGH